MHRRFVDKKGAEWEVWEVRPARPERRTRDRRRNADRSFTGEDRRAGSDRRKRKDRLRTVLPPDLVDGWLTFMSGGEVRRYAPIPVRWRSMTGAELSELCKEARAVPRR